MYLYVFNFKEPVPVVCNLIENEIQYILRLLQPLQYPSFWDSLRVQKWNWGYSSIFILGTGSWTWIEPIQYLGLRQSCPGSIDPNTFLTILYWKEGW